MITVLKNLSFESFKDVCNVFNLIYLLLFPSNSLQNPPTHLAFEFMSSVIIIISNSPLSPASIGCMLHMYGCEIIIWCMGDLASTSLSSQQLPIAFQFGWCFRNSFPIHAWNFSALIMCRQPQLLRVDIFTSHIMPRRQCFTILFPAFWLLHWDAHWALGGGSWYRWPNDGWALNNYSTFCKDFLCLRRIFDQ